MTIAVLTWPFVQNYEPKYWYYEVCEKVRLVLISCIGLLFMEGSSTQVVFVVLINILSGVMALKMQPFLSDDEDFTYTLAQWSAFLLSFFALLERTSVTATDGYNQVGLTIVLAGSQVGVCGAAVAIGGDALGGLGVVAVVDLLTVLLCRA